MTPLIFWTILLIGLLLIALKIGLVLKVVVGLMKLFDRYVLGVKEKPIEEHSKETTGNESEDTEMSESKGYESSAVMDSEDNNEE